MTAGNPSSSDGNTTPVRPSKPAPPTSAHKVENRPELVGGLPLWLTVGAAGQIRRFMDTFNLTPFAVLRRRTVELMENKLARRETHSTADTELPVGRVLRKIADTMEEEMASMRLALSTVKTELMQTQAQLQRVTTELDFLKLRNANRVDSDRDIAATATRMRILLCKEQTRAAAAEKKFEIAKRRIIALEKKRSGLAADFVKLSALYTSMLVVVVSFLAQSPFGPAILNYLVVGGQ